MYLVSPLSSPSSVLASSISRSFPGASAAPVRTSMLASEQEQRLGFGHDFVSRSTLAGNRGDRSRRDLLLVSLTSYSSMLAVSSASGKVKGSNPYNEKRLLEQNKKIQAANNAPDDFPNFVREGFQVKVVTSDNYVTTDSGLIYLDILVGKGDCPKEGQQVTFHYVGYNESGRRIDSTYLQDRPAKIRLGNKSLVPGFEEGIRNMRPGGKRRVIIPPELGPPVGPSTFFSAKQFEVFDIELLDVKDCQRRTIGFYSDFVCN
ncbi:peptidyl-prolyl cis-trans isomerase FKBP20-2, chloroplastic [Curcuma longa]|uniref:peptidyl-prolyl cis-trans isomerase FKBP20-2, chloroplastic n=1 Tax=Curcuma longa TaxID=136217 RepID=UPI003D9DCFA9